jgi:hypothetical protein
MIGRRPLVIGIASYVATSIVLLAQAAAGGFCPFT